MFTKYRYFYLYFAYNDIILYLTNKSQKVYFEVCWALVVWPDVWRGGGEERRGEDPPWCLRRLHLLSVGSQSGPDSGGEWSVPAQPQSQYAELNTSSRDVQQ